MSLELRARAEKSLSIEKQTLLVLDSHGFVDNTNTE